MSIHFGFDAGTLEVTKAILGSTKPDTSDVNGQWEFNRHVHNMLLSLAHPAESALMKHKLYVKGQEI